MHQDTLVKREEARVTPMALAKRFKDKVIRPTGFVPAPTEKDHETPMEVDPPRSCNSSTFLTARKRTPSLGDNPKRRRLKHDPPVPVGCAPSAPVGCAPSAPVVPSVLPRMHRDPARCSAEHGRPRNDRPIGNEQSWARLASWFQSTMKPGLQVLHGPTGCGKTFAVHALARRYDVRVTELNASERRDTSTLSEHLEAMEGGAPLHRRVLLLDDADTMEEATFARIAKAFREGRLPPTVVILDNLWCQAARPLHSVMPPKNCVRFDPVDACVIVRNARRLTVTTGRTWVALPTEPNEGRSLGPHARLESALASGTTNFDDDALAGFSLPRLTMDMYVRLADGRCFSPGCNTQHVSAEKLADDVCGDLRQFAIRRACGGSGASARRHQTIWEVTEDIFGHLRPLGCAEAEAAYWRADTIIMPMVHENLPRNAEDVSMLADALDGLSAVEELRERLHPLPEVPAIVAMLPGLGCRAAKPNIKFPTILAHIKHAGVERRKRVGRNHARLGEQYTRNRGFVTRDEIERASLLWSLYVPKALQETGGTSEPSKASGERGKKRAMTQ
jgi:hypothetical protein